MAKDKSKGKETKLSLETKDAAKIQDNAIKAKEAEAKDVPTFQPNEKEDPPPSTKTQSVRTYMFHLLGTYVNISCNWLILWQNVLYLYLGRSRMFLILQETKFQD